MCQLKGCFAVLCLVCGLPSHAANEFDYEHQAKWYDQFRQCRLNRQSPIELNSNDAEISYDIPSLNFEYYDTPYATPAHSENNGHTANVQLPKPKAYLAELWQVYDKLSPHITGGPLPSNRFVAESLHFHWGSRDAHGSEHVINSQRYSMEMHILHRNSRYRTVEEARDHEDGLAVLAMLYAVERTMTGDFEGLKEIIDALAPIAEVNKTAELSSFTLATLLGDLDRAEFYTYAGSLTTPPCSQAVTWIVFAQPIAISHRQMQRFHQLSDGHGALLENNYRSLQPKGNRKVYLRNKRKVIDSVVVAPGFWGLLNANGSVNATQHRQVAAAQ